MGQRLPVWFFFIFSFSSCHWQWHSGCSWLYTGTGVVWWHPSVHRWLRHPPFLPLTLLLTPRPADISVLDKELRGWTQHLGPEAGVSLLWHTVRHSLLSPVAFSLCSHLMWVVSKIKTTAGSVSCQDFLWKMVLSKKRKGNVTSSNIFPS